MGSPSRHHYHRNPIHSSNSSKPKLYNSKPVLKYYEFITMAANGDRYGNDMDSDSDSAPGSPGLDAQQDFDDHVEDLDDKPIKSALKKSTHKEPAPTIIRPTLPPQTEPKDLDLKSLTPLTAEIIARQATINIGTIGHVAHGKSTVVKAISGVQTVRFKNELERNITIKLGYANAKIYKCTNPECPRPSCYKSCGSNTQDEPPCPHCSGNMELLRHVSFVDCPGHDILMATMLNGAAVMDAAFLLVAGNEPCPQPQTSEHLAAVEIMQLRQILILQNKIDLVKEDQALAQQQDIKRF